MQQKKVFAPLKSEIKKLTLRQLSTCKLITSEGLGSLINVSPSQAQRLLYNLKRDGYLDYSILNGKFYRIKSVISPNSDLPVSCGISCEDCLLKTNKGSCIARQFEAQEGAL